MIRIKNLVKTYKVSDGKFYALNNVTLNIEKGEFVAIQGTSGAGKTTLMNIIGCVDNFDSGEYLLDNISVGKLNDRKLSKIRNDKIGFVFQDFALINNKKVLYNVMLPLLYNKKYSYSEAVSKAEATLEKLGIESQKKKVVDQLSGGQKQRVAIARAIVNDPAVILADEPTGALDSKTTSQIMDCFEDLNNQGNTIIIVTHDLQVASRCERTVFIEDGQIR